MYYGAHKAMMEEWLATLTRRRELAALSVRLSGVVARPKGPSGMKSAFLSDVFHALHAKEPFVMPVSQDATCWLTSVDCASIELRARAVRRSRCGAREVTQSRCRRLRVRIGDMVAEIAAQTGSDVNSVSYEPDEPLEAAFGAQPPVTMAAAGALGFANDGDLARLVSRALAVVEREAASRNRAGVALWCLRANRVEVGTAAGITTATVYPSKATGWTTTVVLFLLTTIAMADRMAISMLIGPIKADFGIGDFKASLLVGMAFVLFYMIALLPIGWAADRYSRRRVLTICLIVWSLASMACGLDGRLRLTVRHAHAHRCRRGRHRPGIARHHRREFP